MESFWSGLVCFLPPFSWHHSLGGLDFGVVVALGFCVFASIGGLLMGVIVIILIAAEILVAGINIVVDLYAGVD